jgi:hypothetical protein
MGRYAVGSKGDWQRVADARSISGGGAGTDVPMCSVFPRPLAEMDRCVASNRAESRVSSPSEALAFAKPQVRDSRTKPTREAPTIACCTTRDSCQRTAKYTAERAICAAVARMPAAGAGAGMSLSEGGVKMSAVERGAGMSPAEGGPVVRIGRRERDGPVGRRGQDGRVRKCGRDGHVDKPDTAAGAGKPGAARARKKPGAFPLPALNAKWWAMQGSNLRPTACKAAALPLRQSPKRWSILPYPARLRKPLVVHDDGVTDLDDVVESRRLRRRQVAAPV